MTLRINRDIVQFDPAQGDTVTGIQSAWLEQLWANDWTLDQAVYNFAFTFTPPDYVKGQLAQSWEFTNPSTLVFHLRQGIHWQNIPPANGREFTSDDVSFHWDRMLGLGHGFTKPVPFFGTVAAWQQLTSVIANDKYTVTFNWKTPNPEFILETMQAWGADGTIENPEAVKQWGDLTDWHHAIGTGPFILTDFVGGSSATLVKNPNYWGYDERYPQNQLPYVDSVKYLIMPDDATALAALRTGKIDVMDGLALSQAQSVQKTNPEIVQISVPSTFNITLEPRDDLKPYNDIRVREALQLAIDLPTLAKTYYGGVTDPWPASLTSNYLTGWGYPYSQWPQDLKDQYAYNPTQAKQLLTAAGYPNGFNTDIVVDSVNDMDLLQIVKSYFAAVGVNMDIRPMASAALSTFVTSAHKNDALAQRSTGALGLAYNPLRQLTRFQTGASPNIIMISDPTFDAFYTNAMAATSVDQIKQIVKNANVYVAQQHFVICLLAPTLFSLCQPWMKGYNGQANSISASSGPQLAFFYLSRFWIDHSVK